MSKRHLPSREYLLQCFEYREGKLFWRVRPREHFPNDATWRNWNKRYSGVEAGYHRQQKTGDTVLHYWMVCVRRHMILRSNLVWALHRGEWPLTMMDHANRDSLDDRIENLRLATPTQNVANQKLRKTSLSGFKGVRLDKNVRSKPWMARIGVNRKRIYLGNFSTPEEAHEAYMEAARKYFGEFACSGEPVR